MRSLMGPSHADRNAPSVFPALLVLLVLLPLPATALRTHSCDALVIPWRAGLHYDYYVRYRGDNYIALRRPISDTRYLEVFYGVTYNPSTPDVSPVGSFPGRGNDTWYYFIQGSVKEELLGILEKYRNRGVLGIRIRMGSPILVVVPVLGAANQCLLAAISQELLDAASRLISASKYRGKEYEMKVVFVEYPTNVSEQRVLEALDNVFRRLNVIYAACITPERYVWGGDVERLASLPGSPFAAEELAQACSNLPRIMEVHKKTSRPWYTVYVTRNSVAVEFNAPGAAQLPRSELDKLVEWFREWILTDPGVPLLLVLHGADQEAGPGFPTAPSGTNTTTSPARAPETRVPGGEGRRLPEPWVVAALLVGAAILTSYALARARLGPRGSG